MVKKLRENCGFLDRAQVENRRREKKVRKSKENRGRRKEGLEASAQRKRRDFVKEERASCVLSR